MADYNVTYTATGSFRKLISDATKAKTALEALDGTTKDLGESTEKSTKASEKNARALREEESASSRVDRSTASRVAALKEEAKVLERAHKSRKALNDLAGGSSGSRDKDAKRAYERAAYLARAIRKQRDETGKLTAAQIKQLSVLDGLAKNFRAQQLGYKNLADRQKDVLRVENEISAKRSAAAAQEAKDSEYIDKLKRTHYRNQLKDFQQTTARMDGIFSKSLQDQLKTALAATKKQEAADKKSVESRVKFTENVFRRSLNEQFQERMAAVRKQNSEEEKLQRDAAKKRDADRVRRERDILAGMSGGGGGRDKDRLSFGGSKGRGNKDEERNLASLVGLLEHVGDGFGKAFKSFYAVKATFMGTAIIGIVSSLGALNSALFALGGAGVVAVQALAQLGGVAGAIPGGLFAIGAAAGASILAINGMGAAFKLFGKEKNPAPKTYAEALAKLSPAAQTVTKSLTGMSDQFTNLKKSTQEAVFAPIAKDVGLLNKLFPTLTTVLGTVGNSLGKTGSKFIKAFTSDAWQKSFKQLGTSSATVLDSLGSAALSVVTAFKDIAVAARPLTEFVGKTIAGLARDFSGWAKGLSGGTFEKPMERLSQFIRIIKNFGSIIASVFRAAAPVTDWFMKRFDEVSKGWADTAKNSTGLIGFFKELQPVMSETAKLFGALFRGLAKRVDMPSLALIIEQLRKQLLPALFRLFDVLGSPEVMSSFISALASILDLFASLAESGIIGAFKVVLATIEKISAALAWLAKGPAGTLLGAILAVILPLSIIYKTVGLIGKAISHTLAPLSAMTAKVIALAKGYQTAAVSANAMAAATARASKTNTLGTVTGGQLVRKGTGKAGQLPNLNPAVTGVAAGAGKAAGDAGKLGKALKGVSAAGAGALTALTGFAPAAGAASATGIGFVAVLANIAAQFGYFAAAKNTDAFDWVKDLPGWMQALSGPGIQMGLIEKSSEKATENITKFAKSVVDSGTALNSVSAAKFTGELAKTSQGVKPEQFNEFITKQTDVDPALTSMAKNTNPGVYNSFAAAVRNIASSFGTTGANLTKLNEALPQTAQYLATMGETFDSFNNDPFVRARVGLTSYVTGIRGAKAALIEARTAQKQNQVQIDSLTSSEGRAMLAKQALTRVTKEGVTISTAAGDKVFAIVDSMNQQRAAMLAAGVPLQQVNAQYAKQADELRRVIPLTMANAGAIQQLNAVSGRTVAIVTNLQGKVVTINLKANGGLPTLEQLRQVKGVAESVDGKIITIPIASIDPVTLAKLKEVKGLVTETPDGKVNFDVTVLQDPKTQQVLADLQSGKIAPDQNSKIDIQAENATNVRNAINEVFDAVKRLPQSHNINITTTRTEIVRTQTGKQGIGGQLKHGGPAIHARRGMFVPGPRSRNEDIVPAMLTPGEFVLQKPAVKAIGEKNVEALNALGDSPRKKSGLFSFFKKGGKAKKKKKKPKQTAAEKRLKAQEAFQKAMSNSEEARRREDTQRNISRYGDFVAEKNNAIQVAREDYSRVLRNPNASYADKQSALAGINQAQIDRSEVDLQLEKDRREISDYATAKAYDKKIKNAGKGIKGGKKGSKKAREAYEKKKKNLEDRKQIAANNSSRAGDESQLRYDQLNSARKLQIKKAGVAQANYSLIQKASDPTATTAQREQARLALEASKRDYIDQEIENRRTDADLRKHGIYGAPVAAPEAERASVSSPAMNFAGVSSVARVAAAAVPPTAEAAAPVSASKSTTVGTINVYNPSPEPASRSIHTAIQRATSREP